MLARREALRQGPKFTSLAIALRGKDRKHGPRRGFHGFLFVGEPQAGEVGLVEQGVLAALAEGPEPLLVVALRLLRGSSLLSLRHQSAGPRGEVGKLALAADVGPDRDQDLFGFVPALVRHEVLGSEEGHGDRRSQIG